MSENNNRPKVEIALNQEARLKLVRDKAYTGQNSYGNFYLYTVIEGNVEKSFFATEDVHKRILEEGLHTGDEFLVRKKAVQEGRKVISKIEFEVMSKQPVPPPNGNGNGSHAADPLKEVLLQSILGVDAIIKSAGTQLSDELQKLATTLFLSPGRG